MLILSKKTYTVSLIFKESALPRLETEILMAFLLHKNREFILTHPETKISPVLYKQFKVLETKCLKDWPVAYLTLKKEFYGLNFKVNPAVLIPRPETELFIDNILSLIRDQTFLGELTIIDVGTGSGAIIIAVASELRRLFPTRFKKITLVGTDISVAALNIARQNVKNYKLNKKIKLYHGHLLMPLKLNKQKLLNREFIIAANLPYLTPAQIKKSPTISREPRLALDGGWLGLKYYRELFKQLAKLNSLGLKSHVFCEIDPGQTLKIKLLAKKFFPAAKVKIQNDLAKKNRLLIIKNPG
ncbi:MAG: HemK/PrmC family methyltransferase [Patescibacteria group bacterium]